MDRRKVFGTIFGVGTTVIAGQQLAHAQDTPTVGDLEDRIAELEAQMETVLGRLDALENDSGSEKPDDTSAPESTQTIGGTGQQVTDNFALSEGRYKVSGTCSLQGDFDIFQVWIYGSDDSKDLLFNEVIEADYEGQVTFEAGSAGEFYLEVDTTGTWELTFEKR